MSIKKDSNEASIFEIDNESSMIESNYSFAENSLSYNPLYSEEKKKVEEEKDSETYYPPILLNLGQLLIVIWMTNIGGRIEGTTICIRLF